TRPRRAGTDLGTLMALIALGISGLSFYRSFIYTKQDLEVTVTEVSYMTNQGGVYMSIAFSNGGNRDAAVLRVEPALWNTIRAPSPRSTRRCKASRISRSRRQATSSSRTSARRSSGLTRIFDNALQNCDVGRPFQGRHGEAESIALQFLKCVL